ncbi:cache domain-containing protein [Arthrobacter sp. USHLN218]|uniref:cache domain-containing protein n=1 Tax=Arthrobacter sp. USHLN218 TaxID=3081232 RepID=UPI003018E2C7
MADHGGSLEAIAASVQGHLDAALAELSAAAAAACSLLAGAEQQGRRPVRADLAGIREKLQACLHRPEPPMDGIGIAVAADYLADSAYWLEWWRLGRGGGLEFVAHSLNPRRDAFYDYSSRSWFSSPAASGQTTVTGPYVDIGGTNAYTVTLSLPLITGAGFAGVAGADIPAARFERFLVGPGRGLQPMVLANADLRVIASSSADHLPGALLEDRLADSPNKVPVAAGLHGQAPWFLLLL